MTERASAKSLHDYYNEKFNCETKKYEGIIEQLQKKIAGLKTNVLMLNKINHCLNSKLQSAYNTIRILTSNRELDYDFIKADNLRSTKIIEHHCNSGAAKINSQSMPKKGNSTKNVRFMTDQNKPILQPRNIFLKTQQNQVTSTSSTVKNSKVKPVASTNAKTAGVKPLTTQTSKIPVLASNISKKNLENKDKENVVPSKNKTVANKKAAFAGIKSNVKISKGNTLLKKSSTTDDRPKITGKNTESKRISMNKTFSVHH